MCAPDPRLPAGAFSPKKLSRRRNCKPGALIVRVGDQLIVFPDAGPRPCKGPQCVARAGKGRCPRSVQDSGESAGWSDYPVGEACNVVVAFDPGSIPVEAFVRQRCAKHLKTVGVEDAVAPTWERFDAERHSALLRFVPVPRWTPQGITTRRPIEVAPMCAEPHTPVSGRADVRDLLVSMEENRVEPPILTALYRYYDHRDRLLYVGITDKLSARTTSHIESSSWMDFAVRSTIERYPTRREAEKAEQEAIKTERPLFNSQHNDTPEARVRLVEYLIEQGRTDLLVASVSRG